MSVKKPTDIPFSGTKEQEAQLKAVMEKYKGTDGFLMPVLQQAQDIYGYLPYEVQKWEFLWQKSTALQHSTPSSTCLRKVNTKSAFAWVLPATLKMPAACWTD